MRTRWFGLVGAGALAAGAVASTRTRRREYIPAEVRIPFTAVRSPSIGPALLPVFRLVSRIPDTAVEDVSVERRIVSSSEGSDRYVLVFRPSTAQSAGPVLFYVHGGGMLGGAPTMLQNRLSRYAQDLGMVVVAAQYRLAPEHPYPVPLADVRSAYDWVRSNAVQLDIDGDRVVVAGESAGGLLVAGLCQQLLDEKQPLPALQVLSQPMLDDRTVLRRRPRFRGQIAWTPRSNRFGWTSYLGHAPREDLDESYATPARRKDLEGLPPAWIGVGTLDLFHDEDVEYAERLRAAGVPVDLVEVTGGYHGFDTLSESALGSRYRGQLISAVLDAVKR